jgi:hypothetical protein
VFALGNSIFGMLAAMAAFFFSEDAILPLEFRPG